ncbi:pentapeptide repeat-containing protein [Planktomarina temperata]|nr:pentapeptide repeat-containing protein [Planktomarina temperata]
MKQLTVPIAFLMTIGSQVSAFDHADLQRLIDTGDCAACDLEGADLTDANMEGVIFCNTTMPDGSVIYSGC